LNEEGEELTLVRVIQITITLTAVSLARVIQKPSLISDVRDGANVAVALIKYLIDRTWIRELLISNAGVKYSHGCDSRFGIIQPVLPALSKLDVLWVLSVLESLDASIDSPEQLTT
jgi:hypothetical protein